jgi:hypothetical protein
MSSVTLVTLNEHGVDGVSISGAGDSINVLQNVPYLQIRGTGLEPLAPYSVTVIQHVAYVTRAHISLPLTVITMTDAEQDFFSLLRAMFPRADVPVWSKKLVYVLDLIRREYPAFMAIATKFKSLALASAGAV